MNSLSSIVAREGLENDSKLNILCTNTSNRRLISIIKKLRYNLMCYDDLYFHYKTPNIIVCTDKIVSYQKISIISIQFHIPIIIIDDEPMGSIIDQSKIDLINNIPNVYSVATSLEVAKSWKHTYNQILDLDISKLNDWKSLLYNVSKGMFKL